MSSDLPPYCIPRTEIHHLYSAAIDQEYQISVALPRGYSAESHPLPVLYLLDAAALFGTVAEGQRLMSLVQEIPDIVIVGIGYPVQDFTETVNLRRRDLTPTQDRRVLEDLAEKNAGEVPTRAMGYAEDFYRFIREDLMLFLQGHYLVDLLDQGIAGCSFGGLFAAYCLFRHPGTFQRYLLCSPSLWWDEGVILEHERQFAETSTSLGARVFLSVGELDSERMVANVRLLDKTLRERSYKDLHLSTHIFEQETHVSVGAAALWRGLREVYG